MRRECHKAFQSIESEGGNVCYFLFTTWSAKLLTHTHMTSTLKNGVLLYYKGFYKTRWGRMIGVNEGEFHLCPLCRQEILTEEEEEIVDTAARIGDRVGIEGVLLALGFEFLNG